MWFILFSRAVTVENCHNSTIVLGVTKTAVNVIGCDSCSFFAVCDRVSIRFVLIPSHSSTHLAKRAQLLLWNVRESLRSENEIRVLSARGLFSSFPSSRNLLLLIESNQSLNPVFYTCFQGKISITTARMLCLDDTLDWEDPLMTFSLFSEVHNSTL